MINTVKVWTKTTIAISNSKNASGNIIINNIIPKNNNSILTNNKHMGQCWKTDSELWKENPVRHHFVSIKNNREA
jgi:hypothetical protein